MCQTIHSVPRFHAALFRPCRRRWAILLSLDTKLFGEPQRQQLPTACPAPPINLHNFFTRIHAADTHSRARRAPALTCLQHAQGSFALYAPLRSYSSTHVPADALTCSPRSCTHVPAARTRLSCPVRSSALLQLHSRACCTHKALLPCTLPCALSSPHSAHSLCTFPCALHTGCAQC